MTAKDLEEPPPSLVENGSFHLGRFNAPSPRLNMLDVALPYHYPVPRFAKNLRLKEWRAFQFGDERWFFFTALYSVKPANLAIFIAYDRKARKSHGFKRIFVGRPYEFSETIFPSRQIYMRGKSRFVVDCAAEGNRIELTVERQHRDPRESFSGRFRLVYTSQSCAPISVCLPLGLNRAMYSTKVLMPLIGKFIIGGEPYLFETPGALGIMDDHKGFYPWRLRYDWVTGFGLDAKGRRCGFNLTDNQVKDQARYNENCMWINSRIWSLPPVKVTRPSGPKGPWNIQDTEGMVDLVFLPEEANDIHFNAGIVACDYHGPFGSFRGTLKNGAGEKIDAECLFGAGEQQYLRS
jgi:hypothetical protein